MIEMTFKNIATNIKGTMNDAAKKAQHTMIKGVSIDTRTISSDNLFIPFVGENVDGHKFIDMAFRLGASLSLTERPGDLERPQPVILVENGLVALQQLAETYLNIVKPKVVGITGSNGKATTKNMIECLLKPYFKVQKTIGNFNNEIGLPLTLLQLNPDTEVSILEMGMDQTGDIDFLSKLTSPDIAVLTNVGESHIEKLGSREAIALGKYEIVNGLEPDGTFIYSGDYPLLNELVKGDTPFQKISAGIEAHNDFIITDIVQTESGTEFNVSGVESSIHIPQLGLHNAQNAALALQVAAVLDIPPDKAHHHFSDLKVTDMRMSQSRLQNGALLINDAYNASVSSMKSALDSIVNIEANARIVVLADILELGDYTEELHQQVGAHINALGDDISMVITHGARARYIYDAISHERKQHIDDIETIVKCLKSSLNDRTVLLLKGSRGMKLEQIAEKLV